MATIGDPEDRGASSGWPASLLGALRELAGRVVPISDSPQGAAGRAALAAGALLGLRPSDLSQPAAARSRLLTVAQASLPYAAARARKVRSELARAGTLDGFVQNGADYSAPAGVVMATYQDSTVLQAVESYGWAHLRGLSQRDIDGLVRRQRAAYESAVSCCAFSQWVADSIISQYGIPAHKVHVVGLGTNSPAGELHPAGRDFSTPRFLFVGFDWGRKNGELVLEAFTELRRSHPDATLDLVGGHPRVDVEGVTGHGALALEDPASRARLNGIYREATAFVLPSKHEPAGTVYIEAGAAGIASIGTSSGGADTSIGDGGYVVDPTVPGEILRAMLALCDPATAQRLGALAHEHALQLTWRKAAERIVRSLEIPGLDHSDLAAYL
jgi:glycosyltransferase involved in cell wall biosynthesis